MSSHVLLNQVDRLINSGAVRIFIPISVLNQIDDNVRDAISQVCKGNDIELQLTTDDCVKGLVHMPDGEKVMIVVKDFPEVEAMRTKRPTLSEYTELLGSGVKFLFSSKFVKHLVIGGCVLMSATMVWGQLILFPMYFSYLLTDVAVSSFRTVLFLPGVATAERSGVWAKRFEPEKWIPRFRALQSGGFIFYMAFAIIMLVLPPANTGIMLQIIIPFTQIVFLELPASNVLPILFMTMTFVFTGLFGGIAEILSQALFCAPLRQSLQYRR
ncbi:MAG: hypothetical protein GF411_18640 [Candidatus Lokiarchaeota archaeon]|nr:hypothetical protein [Candidatus Lokiarchaeota archaeon]